MVWKKHREQNPAQNALEGRDILYGFGSFNVTEYYELIKNEPAYEKEISLSIIMKMAKDVRYTTAFGANNLIVRI